MEFLGTHVAVSKNVKKKKKERFETQLFEENLFSYRSIGFLNTKISLKNEKSQNSGNGCETSSITRGCTQGEIALWLRHISTVSYPGHSRGCSLKVLKSFIKLETSDVRNTLPTFVLYFERFPMS